MALWKAWQDPTFISLVVPEDLITQVRDKHELWMGSMVGIEPLASSNIAINTLSVSFGAITGGITLGIFTTYLLAFNGILIGAVAVLVSQNNLAYPFGFCVSHGSLELPAIFFCWWRWTFNRQSNFVSRQVIAVLMLSACMELKPLSYFMALYRCY